MYACMYMGFVPDINLFVFVFDMVSYHIVYSEFQQKK